MEESDKQTSVNHDSNKPKQLFINDFSIQNILQASNENEGRRPKRMLKERQFYDPSFQISQVNRNAIPVGDGFQCPRCFHWCFYDDTKCSVCSLNCRYVGGTGVVVMKDRTELDLNLKRKKPRLGLIPTASVPISSPSPPLPKEKKKADVEKQIQIENSQECEICFLPFKNLAVHKAHIHGLRKDQFGCPYCYNCFASREGWKRHMDQFHPMLATSSLDTRPKVMPNQPLQKWSKIKCTHCFRVFDGLRMLRIHHARVHSKAPLDTKTLKQLCPFCAPGDLERKKIFSSEDALRHHVALKHPNSKLLALENTCTWIPEKPTRTINDVKSTLLKMYKVNTKIKNKIATPNKELWEPLSFANLFKMLTTVVDIEGGKPNVEKAIGRIQIAISELENNPLTVDENEEHYMAEKRLYERTVRERCTKVEAERCEKARFEEELKARNLPIVKDITKRSDIRAFCKKPIIIDDESITIHDYDVKCELKGCILCGNFFAKTILGETKAKPEPDMEISTPGFRMISCSDIIDKNFTSDRRGCKNKSLNMLLSLKNSKNELRFIRKYNNGLN